MLEDELFKGLLAVTSVAEVEDLISEFEETQGHNIRWVPVGNLENNRGPIEVSTDPGRSLVERITNAIDAILESEHEIHSGIPVCLSPKDAATAWLNIPASGLSEMPPIQRRTIAHRVKVRILQGEGRDARIVEVRDFGIGLTPDQMPNTILSLNASNKVQKHYLAGIYGQGGSSTYASSRFTLIASRHNYQKVGFTLVYYMDLPPERYKTGHYVYLTLDGDVLEIELPNEEFPHGTLVKHFGYDLSLYPSPFGQGSAYGLFNSILFDPVLPVWLEDDIHKTPIHRVIKGSRNALNGAVDEGDEDRRGPKLSHKAKIFYVDLGDFGSIGIEYWVLERPTKENKEPTRAFVNYQKPIILTLNGQNHAEISRILLRKNADLPYLTSRIICHIDCNSLTPYAKRALIASSREEARRGVVLNLIQDELIRALKSDDELMRLNNEAKEQSQRECDASAEKQMRNEVARLLRLQGLEVVEAAGGEVSQKGKSARPTHPKRSRIIPEPIELREPPTFIRFLWPENEQMTFYPEQRRYIRIETDASSYYHNPNNRTASKINFIVTGGLLGFRGSTPLQGGRMRAIFEALPNSTIGSTAMVRVELTRPGLSTLFDEKSILIVKPPLVSSPKRQVAFPPVKIEPVEGPEDQRWSDLGWPDNEKTIASSTLEHEGQLIIYYSTVFPIFLNRLKNLEQRDPSLASSFIKRYEIWLVVHSLIFYQDQKAAELDSTKEKPIQSDIDHELIEQYERQERCRMATLSVLFASREIKMPTELLEGE